MLLTLISLASADPYQIVALYKPTDPQKSLLEVPIPTGGTVPDRGDEYTLDKVVLRFDQAGLGAATTATYRNFVVSTSVGGADSSHESVDAASIKPTADQVLLSSAVGLKTRITPVTVGVRAKFDSGFLCGQESQVRLSGTKRPTPLPTYTMTTPEKKKVVKSLFFKNDDDEPKRAILDGGGEILYSFCAPDAVDWTEVAKEGNFDWGGSYTADALREEHKRRLSKLVAATGALAQIGAAAGGVKVAADAPGYPTNVYVEQEFTFNVLATAALFSLEERGYSVTGPGRTLIDVRSRLSVKADFTPVECQNLRDQRLSYDVVDPADSTKKVAAPPTFRDACRVDLDIDLDLYRQKSMDVVVSWDLEGKAKLTLAHESFAVHQLGLVTSFPVVSEIALAAKGGNPADIAEASSVPIGVAIPVDGGTPQVAVMFPWKLGMNFREAPNLASYISIFPHVALTYPTAVEADGAKAEAVPVVSLGAGIALAEAFHFAWAIDPKSGASAIVLGVSATDIADLVNLLP